MLATSVSLNRPSSGHMFKRLNNAGAYNTIRQYHGIPFTFLLFFIINTAIVLLFVISVFDIGTIHVLPKFLLIDNRILKL
jgi:hypothetical protein